MLLLLRGPARTKNLRWTANVAVVDQTGSHIGTVVAQCGTSSHKPVLSLVGGPV